MFDEVFVNGRCLKRPVTGVERYAGELTKRIFPPGRVISPGKPLTGLAGHSWEQATLPKRLPRGSLLWSPANTGPLRVREQAVTIHDLAALDHPDWYRPAFGLWLRFLLPRLARNARLVITVSRFSRGRIMERFGLPGERVVVVPAGVDREVFYPRNSWEVEKVKRKFSLSGDYLLAVGTLQPRKNLSGLQQAWSSVGRDYPDLTLVITGGVNRVVFQDGESIADSRQTVWTGYVPDGELAALYSGARSLIFASFYEGFGLPLLEAMACGSPVLASQASALPETGGEAALYFEPGSWLALAEAIRVVLADTSLCEDLQRKGFERVSAYAWENSAGALNRYLASIN